MSRRPVAAIVLLAVGGFYVIYYSSFLTDIGLHCPSGVAAGCTIYSVLTGLSWATGIASLAAVLFLAYRPMLHRAAGAVPGVLSSSLLTTGVLLLRESLQPSAGWFVFVLVFLWPYFLVIVGGILAVLWRSKEPDVRVTAP
jgi:hypothetical protein